MGSKQSAQVKELEQITEKRVVLNLDKFSKEETEEIIDKLAHSKRTFKTTVLKGITKDNCPEFPTLKKLVTITSDYVHFYTAISQDELENSFKTEFAQSLFNLQSKNIHNKGEKGLDVAVYKKRINKFGTKNEIFMLINLHRNRVPEVYYSGRVLSEEVIQESDILKDIMKTKLKIRYMKLAYDVEVLTLMKLVRYSHGKLFIEMNNDINNTRDFCEKFMHATARMGTEILLYDYVDVRVHDKCWSIYDEYMHVTLKKGELAHVSIDMTCWGKELTSRLLENKAKLNKFKRLDLKNAKHFYRAGYVRKALEVVTEELIFTHEIVCRGWDLRIRSERELEVFDHSRLPAACKVLRYRVYGETMANCYLARNLIKPNIPKTASTSKS